MNEILQMNLLARTSLSGKKRMIYGTCNQNNKTIQVCFNNRWTWDDTDRTWNVDSNYSGRVICSGTSDSHGDFEIIIPEDLIIENLTFDSRYGGNGNNVEYLTTINLSYLGDVSGLTRLLYAFSNLEHVTMISGFGKFTNCPLITMEGCFNDCPRLTTVDLTGLRTDDMVMVDGATDGRQRYGMPNCFSGDIALANLTLPKIPSTCYMGESTFKDCTSLASITCTSDIENSIKMLSSPLTLESSRTVLSHLSSTHATNAECNFKASVWMTALADSQCQQSITAARANGWILPLYIDDCISESHFNTSSAGYYLVGTEASGAVHPNAIELGQVYVICNEPSSLGPNQHDHIEYRFTSSVDLTDARKLVLGVKTFNALSSSELSGNGITRTAKNTRTQVANDYATKNNYYKVFVAFVDNNGNVTSYNYDDSNKTLSPESYDESTQTTDTLTYTLSLPSSGFNKSNVVGFNVMYMKPDTSSGTARVKGCWFNSITIS